MKIVIAPDKFKGSLSAPEAAEAMARGVKQRLGDGVAIDLCPVADGGEGTVDALVEATGGEYRRAQVTGPLGEPVDAMWGMLGDGRTAVIEMAAAAGLALIPEDKRDPTTTTTYGVGELMLAALDAGATKIIVGIGGSGTTDGGAGMAQALGVRFEGGVTPMTGKALKEVSAIDMSGLDPRVRQMAEARQAGGQDEGGVLVASDVTNPLCGPEGAAAVFGPQKGATAEHVSLLDSGLDHLAGLVEIVDPAAPGMGAAGGLGFGLVAFAGAKLEPGIDLVLDAVGFAKRVQGADLVLTGEGKLDGQSLQGKACVGVAQAAKRAGVKTIALVGVAGEGAEKTLNAGLTRYHALVGDDVTPEQAMANAGQLLTALARDVVGDEV